ncbi:secreted salivary gland peptide-like protein [Dinothrombium tinctorium]|uniref:Secreted salivary gland peptide-like protein n=1 Tax=Dinothrombium tinctorium TaxID=1965070 RepID=A0A3S3P662_9ACAR|nr:secreted salivary gland peptide-like protein [Dinothrombium tinctorium]RWS15761.1 secreted salivary gland peptide-like protein [Dinothrombium tinctorium]
MNFTQLILLFGLLLIDISIGAKKNKSRQCDVKRMDRCATVVFVFGRRDVYLPKNQKEMVPHCQEEFEAEDCVRSYARRCLRPFPRQLIGVILLGASKVIKERCTPEGTKEYLTHYTCIKKTIPKLHDCMDQLVVSLQAIVQKPADTRIPTACCAFSRYIACSIKPIRKMCPEDATAEEYIAVKMIKGYASEVLDLACQGFEIGNERCNKITIPDGGFQEKNGELVLVKNITDKPLSLIPPFTDIFTQS